MFGSGTAGSRFFNRVSMSCSFNVILVSRAYGFVCVWVRAHPVYICACAFDAVVFLYRLLLSEVGLFTEPGVHQLGGGGELVSQQAPGN